MERDPDNSVAATPPPRGGRFSWSRLAVWLIAAPIVGAIAAWVAMIGQSYWAPLGLFAILVGVGLGAMLVGLMRVAQIGNRPTLFAGAVLAAAVAVAAQHYLSFHEMRRQHERHDAELLGKARAAFPEFFQGRSVGPPESFPQYMQEQADLGLPLVAGRKATGIWAWVVWAIDGLLTLGATITLMIPATRQPYCDRCHTWYRTIRSGRIPPGIAVGLGELVHAELGEHVKSARCRLSNCSGGCGPTRLELSWEEPNVQTFLTTAWLDADGRDRASRTLDGA